MNTRENPSEAGIRVARARGRHGADRGCRARRARGDARRRVARAGSSAERDADARPARGRAHRARLAVPARGVRRQHPAPRLGGARRGRGGARERTSARVPDGSRARCARRGVRAEGGGEQLGGVPPQRARRARAAVPARRVAVARRRRVRGALRRDRRRERLARGHRDQLPKDGRLETRARGSRVRAGRAPRAAEDGSRRARGGRGDDRRRQPRAPRGVAGSPETATRESDRERLENADREPHGPAGGLRRVRHELPEKRPEKVGRAVPGQRRTRRDGARFEKADGDVRERRVGRQVRGVQKPRRRRGGCELLRRERVFPGETTGVAAGVRVHRGGRVALRAVPGRAPGLLLAHAARLVLRAGARTSGGAPPPGRALSAHRGAPVPGGGGDQKRSRSRGWGDAEREEGV